MWADAFFYEKDSCLSQNIQNLFKRLHEFWLFMSVFITINDFYKIK